jgi:hypothetical protein
MAYQQMGSMWYDPETGAISATNPGAAAAPSAPQTLPQVMSAAPQGVSQGDWSANQMMQQMGMANGTTPTPPPAAAPQPSFQQMAGAANNAPPTGLNFTPRGTIDPQILDYYKNNPAFSGTASMQLGKPIMAGGYQISPSFNALNGNSANGTQSGGEFNGVSAWDGKDPKYQQYDATGKYLGDYDVSHHSLMEKVAPFIPALFAGGAMALGGGAAMGGTTAATGGGISSTLDGAMFPYAATAGGEIGAGTAELSAGAGLGVGAPLGADAMAAYGGLAGSVTPEAMAGTMGMTPGAFEALGAGGIGAAGAAAGMGAGTSAGSGIGSTLLNGAGKAGVGSVLNSILNGGGSDSNSGGSGGGSGGGIFGNLNGTDISSLLGMLGGGVDAYRQGKAAQDMKAWLDSQQGKIDNLYKPGSPEYNALWDQMSRQDAAAGRNSQYGPRSVDLAARIAQIKADETTRFTAGTSRAYSDALNQNAGRFAGLNAGLNNGNQLGGGLGPLLNKILKGGSNTDLTSLLNQIGVSPQQMTQAGYTGAANDAMSASDYAGLPDGAWGAVANGVSPEDDPFSLFW